ncbi:PfkB family carbohydrate kinase [Nocardioides caldifontis]|uniref:PfkB family carbohydrate kinase n=1 Tax=Nocardioides caldifontis TaxID=2588938 RepID=UPI0011DF37E2|nr:PfkB family carbohydrate kinase [Nocardioides caldifontis]
MSRPLVVVGDALLDVDLEGRATRLTPDAPVPVLDDLAERPRPGGAALAAAMAAVDGHEVVLVTALGDDDAGREVERLLNGVTVHRLRHDGPTPVKKRVRAAGQSLLRLDTGTTPGTLEDDVTGLEPLLRSASAVLVSDYGRGVTSLPALRRLLTDLPRRTPVVWDPHPRGSEPVPGVRLATPNEAEAAAFAERLDVAAAGGSPLAAAGRRADALVAGWQAQAVAVTLGSRGALLSYGEGAPVVTPAPEVVGLDPCGAGDRFASIAALGLAAGKVTTEAVQDAVLGAAAYVGAGGPASLLGAPPPTTDAGRGAEELVVTVAARGGTVVATGGCFDLLHAGHVATLRAARRLGDCLVVCLNSDDSVRRLKGPTRPLVPAADRARVLEALECVDAVVVFDEDTPVEVLRRLQPHVWAKGGDYAGADVPEAAVLREWDGQAVVLPYLRGRSTTGLVETAVATRAVPDPDIDTHTHTHTETVIDPEESPA